VIYQIFPDRFSNGDTANDTAVMDPQYDDVHPVIHQSWNEAPLGGSDFFGGDLQGIVDKLPYLKDLGVNTLYLNPIFLAPSNHKYDTSDYFRIDPHFGTAETLQHLLRAAHDAGMRIVLDGVFNHTGSDSVYFNRYGHFPDAGAFQSRQSPYFPWYAFQSWPSTYLSFDGYDSLPQLQENDPVKDFIFRTPDSVAQHWLGMGADGWRLDAAQLKSDRWWQEFRTAIKARFPDDILIAEETAGPIDPTPFIMGDQFDGIMNYNFRDTLVSFFTQGRGGNGGSTATSLVNNLMALVQDYPRPAILSSMNLVDSHDTERILTDLLGDKRELKLVAGLQMTWLGAPTIYYGDEAGQTGGTDPDDRRTFPWDHQDTDLEAYYRKLIGIRNANPALQDGGALPLLVDNAHRVVAFLRSDQKQRVVVILNDGRSARTVKLKVPGIPGGASLTDALAGKVYRAPAGALSIQLPAHGMAILAQSPASRARNSIRMIQ
jgi:glycosidase